MHQPRLVVFLTFAFAAASSAQPGGQATDTRPGTAPGGAPASARESTFAIEPTKVFSNIARSELRERALAELQDLARSDSALLRANAIEGLQTVPTRAEPLVRAGLADENLGVRFSAAMTAGRIKLKSSASMIKPLLRDPEPSVRAAAIFALCRLGVQADQTELASMLMSGEMRTRANAAFILGEIGNKSAAPLLRDAARSPLGSENPALVRLFRLQIAEALVKLGDKSANDMIEAALYPSSRDDFEAAVLAAQIIGEVKNDKAAGQLVSLIEMQPANAPRPADPRKATFLQPRELRLSAASAMAKLGYFGGWYVGDMYAADQEPAVRAQAAYVIGVTAHKQTVNPSLARLESMLDDASPLVRCAAAAAVLRVVEKNAG